MRALNFALKCAILSCATSASPRPSSSVGGASPVVGEGGCDYVVVGAGSAGTVVAGRLAAAGHHVCLLEAGTHSQAVLGGCSQELQSVTACPYVPGATNLSVFDVPLGWLEILDEPRFASFEWPLRADPAAAFPAVTRPARAAHTGTAASVAPLPKVARAVGGCGVHNAMIYVRGVPDDFAPGTDWAAMGWSWKDMLAAYKRTENNTDFRDPADAARHSTDGPVAVSFVDEAARAPASRAFEAAAARYGLPQSRDFNGVSARYGVGQYQFLIREGVRDSSAAAFIGPLLNGTRGGRLGNAPIRARGGAVSLMTGTLAARVSFNGTRARGVVLAGLGASGGSTGERVLLARHEVVVTAGALNTPKLLLLSGLGEAQALRDAGVTPLPVPPLPAVGRNLMDGVYIIAQFDLGPDFSRFVDGQGLWGRCKPLGGGPVQPRAVQRFCIEAAEAYAARRTGVFASPGLSVGAFLRSPWAEANGVEADVQLTFHPWDKYQRTWPQRPLPSSIVTVEVSNNHALGRGSVRLDAADPQKPPLVAGPYLRHAQDGKVLAWAMRELRGIMSLLGGTGAKPDSSTAAHSHTGAGWGNGSATVTELLPGADLQTDEELIEYARCGAAQFRPPNVTCDGRYLAVTHLGGTARMGANASQGVVDAQLRVHGVEGLRVADASVMPTLPSGNTHATCMAIGERAAQMLIDDAAKRKAQAK